MRKEFKNRFKVYPNVEIKHRGISYATPPVKTTMTKYSSKNIRKEQNEIIDDIVKNKYSMLTQWTTYYTFTITLSDDLEELFNSFVDTHYSRDLENNYIFKNKEYASGIITPSIGWLNTRRIKSNPDHGLFDAYHRDNTNNPLKKSNKFSYTFIELADKLMARMARMPKWDEKNFFYMVALLCFMDSSGFEQTTFGTYIEQNEDELFNKAFMNFETTKNSSILSKVSIFYKAMVLSKTINILDEKIYQKFEELTYEEWNNVLNFTKFYGMTEDSFNNLSRYSRARSNPRSSYLLTEYIDFAKAKRTGYVTYNKKTKQYSADEMFFVNKLQDIWQEKTQQENSLDINVAKTLDNYWKRNVLQLGKYNSRKFTKTYIYGAVEFLEKNASKLNLMQLFSLGMIFVDAGAFCRKSAVNNQDNNFKSTRIILEIAKYHEDNIQDFADFIESLIFDYNGILPTPLEWEKGYKEFDLDTFKDVPLSLIHSMIAIYDKPKNASNLLSNTYTNLRADFQNKTNNH